jgi:acetoin utilization deacetylase AcuC-like enzyme
MNRRGFLSTVSKGLTVAGMAGPFCMAHARLKSAPSSKTGYACDHDEIMFSHPHPTELPERIHWIQQYFDQSNLTAELRPIAAIADPYAYVGMVHTPEHIAAIKSIPQTGPAAELAAASVLGAVRDVCAGTITNAFCSIRPPGHHSHNAGGEEGFCFFCNAAIAAKYAQTACGIKRVLIIDWDYHHGNGTQYAFYSDPTVLFFSTHNADAYPGRQCDLYTWEGQQIYIGSDPLCTGIGPGEGFNINVHMPCDSGNDDFVAALNTNLLPAADAFKPELVLISAGFDSKKNDMLGCFQLTTIGYSRLTRIAMNIAEKHCNGRLVSILEGGYADRDSYPYEFAGLASCAESHTRTLLTGDVLTTEAPYYQAERISPRQLHAEQEISIRDGILHLPRGLVNRPVAISITDVSGRAVFSERREIPADGRIDLRRRSLAPGSYVVATRLSPSWSVERWLHVVR